MSNEYIKMIEQRLIEMREKKGLSPAQKKHLDKDKDGDIDGKDFEILRKKKDESSDKMTPCPSCDGSMDNHDPECPKAKNESTDLDDKSATKALKHDCATHVTSEQWGYGECISGQHTLEEQEDGTGIVTHYDVMFEHGVEFNVSVEDLTIVQEKSHMHASKQYMDRGKGKMANDGANKDATDAKARIKARAAKRAGMKESVFSDDKRREHEKAADHHADQAQHHTTQMNKAKSAGAHPSEFDHHKVLAKMHDRAQASHAKAVVYSRRGQHQQANSHSQIANGHSDAVKKKAATYESVVYEENRAKHYKGATKPESMLDKFKGKGAQDMAKDNNVGNPKHAEITPEEEGHEDATKAGRAVSKQAPVRGGESRKGDTSIVNPVKGAVTKTTGRE